jgi:hypothetical protein
LINRRLRNCSPLAAYAPTWIDAEQTWQGRQRRSSQPLGRELERLLIAFYHQAQGKPGQTERLYSQVFPLDLGDPPFTYTAA